MLDFFTAIQNTPLPIILILAGLLFILLGFVSKLGGFIEVSSEHRRLSIPIGLLVLTIGLVLNFAPNTVTITPPSSAVPQVGCRDARNAINRAGKLGDLETLITTDCAIMYREGFILPASGGTVNKAVCVPAWNSLVSSGQIKNVKFLVTHNCPNSFAGDG